MESSFSKWRCLYIRPEDIPLCIRTHVVGCSSHPPLLEVAVHPQVPIAHPYLNLPDVAPIAIDSLVVAQETDESWQSAQIQALYKFVKQAELGISTFGPQIGDYYRQRYPNVQPWIEYLIIDHDLPKSDLSSRRKNKALLIEFSRAVLFLVLSVADPHDPATERLKDMSAPQIVETLRSTLQAEFKKLHRYSQINLGTVGLIRHVLVQVGGTQNLAQMNLLNDKCRDIHVSSVFASLMGITQNSICSGRNPIGTLTDQLLSSQAFDGLRVDWLLVTKMTQKLKLPFWVFVTSIPHEWTSGLSSHLWRSLRLLLNDASYLHQSLRKPHNSERLFSIWAYLVFQTYPEARDQIQKSAENICSGAIWSLKGSQTTPAQMALDLMTLLCISRLFPKETSVQQESSSVESLDRLLKKNCRNDMIDPLNRLLESLRRVLSADNFASREPNLARFISLIGLPNPLLELSDAYADQYFADRIVNGSGHEAAFAKLCSRIGWFPVKLAPINLSEENS